MKWHICFSIVGVIISILYFCTMGIISEKVEIEENPQLSDEFDMEPIFETNERFFTISEEDLVKSNKIVYDNFVVNYTNYPIDKINLIIGHNSMYDRSAASSLTRFNPETLIPYSASQVKNICNSQKESIRPQAANYEGNLWVVVFNQGDFVQEVPIEKCVYSKPREHLNLDKTVLTGNVSKLICQQVYSTIDLFVFVSGKLKKFEFKFESACEPLKRAAF